MKTLTRFLGFGLALFALVLTTVGALHAQPVDEGEGMTPSRLSVVEGPVSFWRPGWDDWAAAQLNAALAAGDAVHAGDRGTAEIQVGPHDYVRLTSHTMLTIVAQEVGLLQFRVSSGTASFDLRSVQAGQMVEIDAPQGAIVASGVGYYRVDIRGNATHVTVRRGGQARLSLEGNRSLSISSNEEVILLGAGAAVSVERRAAGEPDSWDRWNYARSDYYANSQSQRYVPAGVYGVADLDQHGSWREVPTYGHVWMPAVTAGWVPYSTGSWQWDPVFGWTWVDLAPWGWATSHHGRWVFIDGSWAWAPGPRSARPVYAPALVAFLEGGSGIGWVALGWGEPLIPWWGRPGFRGTAWWGGWGGPRMVNRHVHRHGSVDVGTIRFVHATVPNAVISVRQEEFHRYRQRHQLRQAPPQARALVPIRGVHPVRPAAPASPVRQTIQQPLSQPAVQPAPQRVAPAPAQVAPQAVPQVVPQVVPQGAVPQTTPAPRTEPVPPMREMHQRRERERGPDTAPAPSVAPTPVPAPVVVPPAVQRPQAAPAPVVAPAPMVAPPPAVQRPQPMPVPTPAPQVAPQPVPQPTPQPAPQAVPPPRPEPQQMREMHQRRERERGPDTAPAPSMMPTPVPAPVIVPPAVQRPQAAPAPVVAPPPAVQRPQPQSMPAPMPAPMAIPSAPPVQRAPVMAPMPGMGPSMSGGEPRVFREREFERRHEERPRQETRREPQQQQQQQGEPSPQGRPFPRMRE